MDGQGELLRLLREHSAEHPDGCTETDLMQRSAEFTLRSLRQSAGELEGAGKLSRVADGRGGYLISLSAAG
jgi:hypothetical protein